MQTSYIFKISYNSNMRRFSMANDISYSSLYDKIRNVFALGESEIQLKYTDEDGDSITFDSDKELACALTCASDAIVRIEASDPRQRSVLDSLSFQTKSTFTNTHSFHQGAKRKWRVEIPEDKLQFLQEIGFTDEKANFRIMRRLYKNEQDFARVVDRLLAQEQKRSSKAQKRMRKKCKKDCRRNKHENKKDSWTKHKQADNERPGLYEKVQELDWSAISHLYLDGNNMLFLTKYLRELTLSKRRSAAEELLSSIACEFGKAQQLSNVTMAYDATKLPNIPADPTAATQFVQFCARPKYKTADDYLVELATNDPKVSSAVFVTSDRELCERLKSAGALLVKPKKWLIHAASVLANSSDLDEFLTNFGSPVQSPSLTEVTNAVNELSIEK
eukprot:TRINITY_DN1092_c0_g1_i1.p1 TRINITY_DN1092_c0_g1~~TRINITY_DN1092_c0_g1_i1.p1  ORF type:complete len:389 (-),score=64.75 TRINITY_DN1092_c0_g1_i1:72-1238(-)